MALVEVHEHVLAPIETVWEVVNDVESYPRLMEPVRSLEVLERGPDFRVTAWEVDLKGCIMRWVEREDADRDRWRIDYRQVEGDLETFEGYWQLRRAAEDSSHVTLSVRFDLGMPMLSEMLDPIAERAIRDNSRLMLHSLASHAAKAVR
jgi:coenzyme Q-binding protein COQ10